MVGVCVLSGVVAIAIAVANRLVAKPSRVGFSLFYNILVSSSSANLLIVSLISLFIHLGCFSYCKTSYSSLYMGTLLLFLPI